MNDSSKQIGVNGKIYLNEKDESILCSFFKFHRKKQGLSLDNLTEILRKKYSMIIDKGRLSNFENGKCLMSEIIYNKLLQILDIEIYDYKQNDPSISLIILEVFNCFCELELDEERILYCKIIENKQYLYSLKFAQFILIELMYNIRITKNHDYIKKMLFELEFYLSLLNDNEYAIYKLYEGIYAFNNHNYDNAYDNFIKALEKLGSSQNSIRGMIYYYLNFIKQEQNQICSALKYCQLSIDDFSKETNYVRVISLKMHIANCYNRLNQFLEAKDLYFEVIKKMNIFGRSNINKVIYYNLSGLLLKMESYEETIKYSRIALASGMIMEHAFIYIPFSLFRLGRIDEMLTEIKNAKAHPKITKAQITFFNALIFKVKNNENKAINCMKKYHKIIIKQNDTEIEIFALRIIFEWLIDNKQFEEATEYGKIFFMK